MNLKEKIKVMQAFEDGAEIEFKLCDSAWKNATRPHWDWFDNNYRVKEVPEIDWSKVDRGTKWWW